MYLLLSVHVAAPAGTCFMLLVGCVSLADILTYSICIYSAFWYFIYLQLKFLASSSMCGLWY